MDKASIIKDAVEYIESLQDEERRIQAEMSELQSEMSSSTISDVDREVTRICSKRKRSRMEQYCCDSAASGLINPPPIEFLELRVSNMGEKTIVVRLSCSKRRDTMIKLCEAFESLKLNIITFSINPVCGRPLKTLFLEGYEKERKMVDLRVKIEAAMAAINDSRSPQGALYQHNDTIFYPT